MRTTALIVVSAIVAAAAAATAQRAGTPPAAPDVAMKMAMNRELVDGDFKAAIEAYKKVVAAAGSNRALAAQALVRMAECYQKLGDAQSRAVWDQIVREYSDQKDAVATARARLGVGAASAGLTTRQMWSGPKVDAYGSVSPDGRFLSFTDWDTGDLALHDFTTGQDRRLTNKGTWEQSSDQAIQSVISRDGKQIAYEWHDGSAIFEVRLLDINGGKPRVLVPNIAGEEVFPQDWSPDGKWIVAMAWRTKDDNGDLALISTADGSLKVLKTFRGDEGGGKVVFSPDGKYLAYNAGPTDKPEVHLLAVDGSGETSIVSQPVNDRVLGWSPDGKRLLFASDRSGLSGLWAVVINDGKPQGAPELIKANVNPLPLGVTRTGALYYSVVSSVPDIYLASVDFETGRIRSGPMPLAQPHLALNNLPQWSRDGKYLAFLSRRDPNSRNGRLNILAIRSTDTGQVRDLHPDVVMLNFGKLPFPLWSADNEYVIVNAFDRQGRHGIYRVDARSGALTPIVLLAPGERFVTARALSPDGGTLYLERVEATSRTTTVFARDLRSGHERELVRMDEQGLASLSPDGRALAVSRARFDKNTQSSALLLVPVDGGAPRELIRTSNPGAESLGAFVTWSPDGKWVIFRKGPAVARETFRIPVDGGSAMTYGAEWSVGPPAISPNGRDVAFVKGQHTIEVWAMENFLPVTKPSR